MKLHSNRIYTPKGPKAGVLTVEGGTLNTATSGSSPAFLILITTAPAVMISRIRMPPMKSRSHP